MPNHCSNCLIIYGPDMERQYVLDCVFSDNNEFDLTKFAFTNIPKGDFAMLRTKWNCYETRLENGIDCDKIYFQTAWCPYSHYVQKMLSSKFPRVQFELLYAERGQEFCGRYKSSYDTFTGTVCFMSEEVECVPTRTCENTCDDDWKLEDPQFDELYQTSGWLDNKHL